MFLKILIFILTIKLIHANDVLESKSCLRPHGLLFSDNSCFFASLLEDGNFVLYQYSTRKALWSTATNNQCVEKICMRWDGNLIVINCDRDVIWRSRTYGNAGAYLKAQNDGNLVIYSKSGVALWSSQTNGEC